MFYRWDRKTDMVEPCRKPDWDADRVVEQTLVGGVSVSTVFLPLAYGWWEGPPLAFETMVFGDEAPTWRYETAREAREGHRRAVEMAKKGGDR